MVDIINWKESFDKIFGIFYSTITVLILAAAIAIGGYFGGNLIMHYYEGSDSTMPVDSIQNHLLWDVNGKCYFVKVNNKYTDYLVPVNDCDKDIIKN